jgi:hypothetical protein
MARAVHNYFMRVCAADEACDRTGQGDRDVA